MFVTPNFCRLLLAALFCLPLATWPDSPIHGQDNVTPTKMLTENVAVGGVAKNLQQFNEKFSALCKAAQIPIHGDDLFDLFYMPLQEPKIDVDKAIHRDGSGGIVILADEFGDNIVVRYMYPVKETNLIAEAIGVDKMEFRGGSAYRLPRSTRSDIVMLDGMMSIGRSLLPIYTYGEKRLSEAEAIDNPFAGSPAIHQYLSPADHEFFADSDATFMLGNHMSRQFWTEALQPLFGKANPDDETWQRLKAAGEEIRFGLASLNMDAGVHVRSKSFFTESDGDAVRLIRDLRGGDQPSDLKYLPDGQVLLAAAAKGTGEQNVSLAKGIVRMVVEAVSPGGEVLSDEDKVEFYKIFGTIWAQLNGTRIGLYRNEGEIGDGGELAVVTIFDAEDPVDLLDSIPDLVKFANDGIRNVTPEGDEPEVSFNFDVDGNPMEGMEDRRVDVLRIDTSRIDPMHVHRFQRFFGESAASIRFVAVEKHVVMFVGTNPALLKAVIDNLVTDKPGLADHPAFVAGNDKLDPRRKIELHFSARNFNYIYSAAIRGRKDLGRYGRPTEVTSIGLTIEEDRFGFDLWVPMKELDRATKLIMALDNF